MSGPRFLSPYWIVAPAELPKEFGVTAYSTEDALKLLAEAKFSVDPAVAEVREVRFEELDANHVVPNMGVISRRGVWYPNLNS